MEMLNEPLLERRAREMHFCLGCAKPKDLGMVVCWECFKGRMDVTPFKYWEGDLMSWLQEIKRKNREAQYGRF